MQEKTECNSLPKPVIHPMVPMCAGPSYQSVCKPVLGRIPVYLKLHDQSSRDSPACHCLPIRATKGERDFEFSIDKPIMLQDVLDPHTLCAICADVADIFVCKVISIHDFCMKLGVLAIKEQAAEVEHWISIVVDVLSLSKPLLLLVWKNPL